MTDGRRTLVAPALVSACLVLACAAGQTQPIDRSKPPAVVSSTGGFTSRRLTALPDIDGRNWIAAAKVFGPARVSAPNGRFTLTLEAAKPNEDTGDLAGFRLYFAEGPAPAVEIGPAFTNFVFVTGDVLGEAEQELGRADGNEVLLKPFRGADLLAAVERCGTRDAAV